MTGPKLRGPGRRPAVVAIAVVAAAIVAIVVAVVATALPHPPAPRHAAAGPALSAPPAEPSPASSSGAPTTTPTSRAPKPSGAPTVVPAAAPQPTRTATLSAPTVIVRSLTARVTKTVAVQGKADGPGEIAGPSVRFTITISNSTGKAVDLSNTVVNAYYGKDATPAVPLRMPGGVDFPASVQNGRSVTGSFVFNIPVASRSLVEVTVDTAVRNPVVAFRGAAPK